MGGVFAPLPARFSQASQRPPKAAEVRPFFLATTIVDCRFLIRDALYSAGQATAICSVCSVVVHAVA